MTGLEKDNIYNVYRQHYKTAKSESNLACSKKNQHSTVVKKTTRRVLTALTMKMIVFWVMMSCNLVQNLTFQKNIHLQSRKVMFLS